MDKIDREILVELQRDGRMSATELARRISLGVSATSERLRQLQRSGVIRRFSAEIDRAAIGRPIEALIDVRLSTGADQAEIDQGYRDLDMVIDAVHLTGRYDVQLRVAARDVAELDELLVYLKERGGAEETNTRVVLRTLDGFPRAAL